MSRHSVNAKAAPEAAPQLPALPEYFQALEMIERAARVDEAKSIRDKAEAFRVYAIKARNRDMEFYASEIRMRAERRAGQILIESKRTKTRRIKGQSHVEGDDMSLPTLADLGLTRDEASKWQRIAKLSERDFEARLARMRANGKPGSFLDTAFSSDSEEWLTPGEILDSVVAVLSAIDLDPCAERKDASANVPALTHFTEKDDGLSKVWKGAVFMNPPYGNQIPAFVEKLMASWRAGTVTQAIALLPSRTDTAWFQALDPAPVCFVRGRIMFARASERRPGEEPAPNCSAPFPSALFYLGPRVDRFAAEFDHFGKVYQVRS